MALPSVSYTFSNGTTASATQVNQNFTDLINALTNSTKSLSIDALTCAGAISGATTFALTGAATLSSTLAVTGATTLSSTLAVTGAATLSSTLGVTGATTLSSTLAVTGAATLSSTLAVTGTTQHTGTVGIGIAAATNESLKTSLSVSNQSGQSAGLDIVLNAVETSATNSNTIYGAYIEPLIGSTNTQNWTNTNPGGLVGVYSDYRHNATNASTVSLAIGVLSRLRVGNAAGTVTENHGFLANNPVNSGTITATSGLSIANHTTGGKNTNLLIGTTTIPTGQNWSIYNSSSYDNSIAGNVRIGSNTAPTVALDVTGAALISSTLGVTGVTTLSARLKSAGRAMAVAAKTSNYTATSTDDVLTGDSSGGTFTFTLPAANAVSGQRLKFIKIDSSTTAITIARAGADTINGATSTKLATQYESVELISDGTSAWYILDRNYPRSWTSSVAGATWTPTGSWVTNCTYTGQWRRIGDTAHFKVNIALAGSPGTPGALTINLPSGFTIDTAKLVGTVSSPLPYLRGQGTILDSGLAHYLAQIAYSSTTAVLIRTSYTATIAATGSSYTATNQADVTHAAPISFAASDTVTVEFEVPIVDWN